MRTDFLDFPTAWDIQREIGHELPHDELCPSVNSNLSLRSVYRSAIYDSAPKCEYPTWNADTDRQGDA